MNMTDPDTSAFCRHCGARGLDHRGSDGRCPGKGPLPSWPRHSRKSPAEQGVMYDARLARYWAERSTSFERVVR